MTGHGRAQAQSFRAGLAQRLLLLDVLPDDAQRSRAAGRGERAGDPPVAVRGGAARAGELSPMRAGRDFLREARQGGHGDLRRVEDQRVQMAGFPFELAQLGLKVVAYLPHRGLAAGEHLVVEDARPMVGHVDHVQVRRRNNMPAAPVGVCRCRRPGAG
jgi:hypothetical protein